MREEEEAATCRKIKVDDTSQREGGMSRSGAEQERGREMQEIHSHTLESLRQAGGEAEPEAQKSHTGVEAETAHILFFVPLKSELAREERGQEDRGGSQGPRSGKWQSKARQK